MTWSTSVPILVFLGLSVLDLGPMYATDVRQTDVRQHHRFMPPPIRGAGITRLKFLHRSSRVHTPKSNVIKHRHCSMVITGLSRTVSEINGDLGLKQIVPISVFYAPPPVSVLQNL